MLKSGIDQDKIIEMFANASASGTDQLRKGVQQATLAALQGRELTLKNIRGVLKTVAESAAAGAAQNKLPNVDVEALLDKAVVGMDEALLKAVEANRVALAQLVSQGADLRDKHLGKALADLEKFEDTLLASVRKAASSAGDQLASSWAPVLEKMQAGGTLSGQISSG